MNNILQYSNYTIDDICPLNMDLYTLIVLYFNGVNWLIIPLDIFKLFPIIINNYTQNNNTYDISIIVCPYSFLSIAIEGNFKYKDDIIAPNLKNGIISIADSNNNEFDLISGKYYNNNNNDNNNDNELNLVMRHEINIMTLRNAMTLHADIKFVHYNNDNNIIKQQYISKIIYSNNLLIHPDTLVYVLEYKSSVTHKYKITILIGSDAKQKSKSGYDIKKSGVLNYITHNNKQIRLKLGFIFPILWKVCKTNFPKATIIRL